jgi:hypothetical protein
MKKLMTIFAATCLVGTTCSGQNLCKFTFTWNTNSSGTIKEYRVYSSDGPITTGFKVIGVTTNNFITVSNMVHRKQSFCVVSIGKDGRESLPSRIVQFPIDLPESPKCFEYVYSNQTITNWNGVEQFVSPTR